ncbi:MAG: adaptor protein MecA [Lachnospiraceae bacterium]|nr:adaptor protein MecA [Lachnospiraceae bacterium]
MRIEKLNDNQIRCTLTKADLADRQLQLSELAYGSEKAKNLFRDMMEQASLDFGFEADNTPLMIEAIPLPNECIVLIITKVEDPEELDTRFAKFAPSTDASSDSLSEENSHLPEGADNILDMFRKLLDHHLKNAKENPEDSKEAVALTEDLDLTRSYHFDSMDTLIEAAHILKDFYSGSNSLYKNEAKAGYRLIVRKSSHSPEEFNKITNILSEYGSGEKYIPTSEAYLEERGALIIRDEALQRLALL